MSELLLMLVSVLKMTAVGISAFLYQLGGYAGTWIRRYITPIIVAMFMTSIMFIDKTFSYFNYLYPILLCGAYHLGYGADTTIEKIKKRFICGLLIGASALPLALTSGNWILYILNIFFNVVVFVVFGVLNPLNNPRDEETMLGLFSVLIPLFMI